MKKRKILRVGFDLDGVILDNPIRIFRFLAKKLKFLKPIFFKQKKEPFYYPKTKLEKFLWWLLHKTSWRINPQIKKLKKLVDQKKIKAYVITGRYSFLANDYLKWVEKLKKLKIFQDFYFNKKDLQPNNFKAKMIKKLKLDIFVEDNWDIVEKLNSKTQANIFWLTNIFDQFISYKNKFRNWKDLLSYLKKSLKNKQIKN